MGGSSNSREPTRWTGLLQQLRPLSQPGVREHLWTRCHPPSSRKPWLRAIVFRRPYTRGWPKQSGGTSSGTRSAAPRPSCSSTSEFHIRAQAAWSPVRGPDRSDREPRPDAMACGWGRGNCDHLGAWLGERDLRCPRALRLSRGVPRAGRKRFRGACKARYAALGTRVLVACWRALKGTDRGLQPARLPWLSA